MTDAKYDVLGIGNAIFDVLVQTDEGFLARHGMGHIPLFFMEVVRSSSRRCYPASVREMTVGDVAVS